MFRRIFLPALCIFSVSFPQVQQRQHYFYQGPRPGSEMMYNPFTLILNGSFDVLQFDGEVKHLDQVQYRSSGRQVVDNLSSPFAVVSRYGTSRFVRQEVLPLSFTPRKMQWWPNYNLHLLGGGMTYVKISEWYDHYGFQHPELLSMATMGVYHFLNETVEMRDHRGDNVDPISDIYIFDIAGIALFSSDAVKEFFSRTVVMSDWSGQPLFSVQDGSLSNNGQYFAFKWKVPSIPHWHLFYLAGVEGIGGLSYRMEDGTSISAGGGFIGSRRRTMDERTFEQSMVLNWRAGFFYDRDNSLLSSLYISGVPSQLVTLNIYPSVMVTDRLAFGGVVNIGRNGTATLGVTVSALPGISIKN